MVHTRITGVVLAFAATALIAIGLSFADTKPQAKRWAFVVGNDLYKNLPAHHQLKKAVNDSRAVAQTFRDLKYDEVLTGENLGRSEFYALWQKLLDTSGPEDTVSIYFSGHGIEIDGRNYLIPSDFPPAVYGREERAKRESISVSDLMLDLKGPKPKAQLVLMILDACRDHPLIPPGQKAVGDGGGLATMDPPSGTFIMYAAGAGQTALDRLPGNDPDANSVYTRQLLPLLKTKGLTIAELAQRVRRDVYELAAKVPHQQIPAYYDGVLNLYCVAGCEEEPAPSVPPTSPAPSVTVSPPQASPASPAAPPTPPPQAAVDAPQTQAANSAPAGAAEPVIAQSAPPPQTAMAADPAAPPDPKVLTRSIQEHLKSNGCFDVEPTGTWGPKTTAAATLYNVKARPPLAEISTTGPTEEAEAILSKQTDHVCEIWQIGTEDSDSRDCEKITLNVQSKSPPVSMPERLSFTMAPALSSGAYSNKMFIVPTEHVTMSTELAIFKKGISKFNLVDRVACARARFKVQVKIVIDAPPSGFWSNFTSTESKGRIVTDVFALAWERSSPDYYGFDWIPVKSFDEPVEFNCEVSAGSTSRCEVKVGNIVRGTQSIAQKVDDVIRTVTLP